MEKLIQFQMPNDLERQLRTAELTATHHMKAGRVDLHPAVQLRPDSPATKQSAAEAPLGCDTTRPTASMPVVCHCHC